MEEVCIVFIIHPRKLRTCVQGEGGPGQCVRTAYGGGSKIGNFLRTYFMDGPLLNRSPKLSFYANMSMVKYNT